MIRDEVQDYIELKGSSLKAPLEEALNACVLAKAPDPQAYFIEHFTRVGAAMREEAAVEAAVGPSAPVARMEDHGFGAAAVAAREGQPSVWLLASATLLAEHDAASQMPPLDALLKEMTAGERPMFGGAAEEGLSCTAPQRQLVEKLRAAYNGAASAQARFELLGRFMVEAAAVEGSVPQRVGGKDHLVTRYDMHVGADPAKAYFAEDYPWGDAAHGKTLALGVCRWRAAAPAARSSPIARARAHPPRCAGRCRFTSKLLELTAQKFGSVAERDAALKAAL